MWPKALFINRSTASLKYHDIIVQKVPKVEVLAKHPPTIPTISHWEEHHPDPKERWLETPWNYYEHTLAVRTTTRLRVVLWPRYPANYFITHRRSGSNKGWVGMQGSAGLAPRTRGTQALGREPGCVPKAQNTREMPKPIRSTPVNPLLISP